MSSQTLSRSSQETNTLAVAADSHLNRLTLKDESYLKVMNCYTTDQQVKYLHLQAEIEVLLQQLQTVQYQKFKEIAHFDSIN